MLLPRVLSAVVGIPVLLWISYTGGTLFKMLIALTILAGIYEYQNMLQKKNAAVSPIIIFLSAAFVVVSFIYPGYSGLLFFAIVFLHIFPMIFGGAKPYDISLSFFGVFYIAWMLGHLIPLREDFSLGFIFVLLCFISTWAADTGAYFSGRFFGKHKLSPVISPKKTVEGAVGGTLISVFAVMTLGHFLRFMPPLPLLLLAFGASFAGQLGDLAESAVKRWAGVKDSGKLIPGHGGVLDRFDSLILAAPVVYYFLTAFIIN